MDERQLVAEVSDTEIAKLRRANTCDISDALTRLDLSAVRAHGILPLRPFDADEEHMAGPAVCIRFLPCHRKMQYQETGFRLTEIVQSVRPGSVIVVEGGDFGKPAQGEINGMTALRAGAAGTVGDGPVRDVDAVRALALPVFYAPYPTGVTMESYVGRAICVSDSVPVQIRGALVRPGDIVVGDNNGVVVVPVEYVSRVLEIVEEIQHLEQELRDRTRAGDSWTDIYTSTHRRKYDETMGDEHR